MISEKPKRKGKSVVMVHCEDQTLADENHARSSGSLQYVAALLPTVDKNQKKEKSTKIRGFIIIIIINIKDWTL